MKPGSHLSSKVISCALKVSNELGAGFLEQVYAHALAIEMSRAGIEFEQEKAIAVDYRDQEVGRYVADFLVNKRLVLELKALRVLTGDHEDQVLNYLAATHVPIGLLINLGQPRVQIKRLVRNHDDSTAI